jgi:hypothetical protein
MEAPTCAGARWHLLHSRLLFAKRHSAAGHRQRIQSPAVVIREPAPLSTIQGLAMLSLFLPTRHQAFLAMLEAPWLVWRPTSAPDAL